MKRAEFDKNSLVSVTSEVPKVLRNLDDIIDTSKGKIDSTEGTLKLEFTKFIELLGKYMSKCLVTISEPYNENLYSVSIDKSVDAGFLPQISSEFYNYLKRFKNCKESIKNVSYNELYKFYVDNHDNIAKVYDHMIVFTDKL
jgi:hypothetical protein